MNHDSAIRCDRGISTIFADWKQTGNICGRFDKVRVFTNFYAAGCANNDVFTGWEREGESRYTSSPAGWWHFRIGFLLFSVQSPLYSRTINPIASNNRSSIDHRAYIIIVYDRSVISETDERRIETQRVWRMYDNATAIKFRGIDACRHFPFGNCRNGQLTSD